MGAGVEALGWSPAQAEAKVRAIGDTVRQVLQRAGADGATTEAAARQLAEQRLAQAPGSVAPTRRSTTLPP